MMRILNKLQLWKKFAILGVLGLALVSVPSVQIGRAHV